jgi:hypothetical protein
VCWGEGREADLVFGLVRYFTLSAPVQTDPRAHPAAYVMGTGVYGGSKAAGAWR